MKVLIKEAQVRTSKNGNNYLAAKVAVEGGEEVPMKLWDYNDNKSPAPGEIWTVNGDWDEWQGKKQLVINSYTVEENTAHLLGDFMEATTFNIDSLRKRLQQIIDIEMSGHEKAVVLAALEIHGDKFEQAPAAKAMHHDWIGGLIEHTTEMCAIYQKIKEHFPGINSNKVFFGLIMHDFCKIFEYKWEEGFIDFKKTGRLMPHIPKSVQMMTRIMDAEQVPEDVQEELMHIVVAHHGKIEYGSPIAPHTLEALMVHWIDNMHGTMFAAIKYVQRSQKHDPSKEFTDKHFLIERAQFMVPKDIVQWGDKAPQVEGEDDDDEVPF